MSLSNVNVVLLLQAELISDLISVPNSSLQMQTNLQKFQVPILVKLVSSLCSEFIYNYFWIQLLLVYTAKVGNTVAISIWLISNYYTSFLNI